MTSSASHAIELYKTCFGRVGNDMGQHPATQPRWRCLRLQCTEQEAKRREGIIANWLSHIGSVACHHVHAFYELLPRLQDGTILALVVQQITSRPIPGILGKPCTMETRHANISKCATSLLCYLQDFLVFLVNCHSQQIVNDCRVLTALCGMPGFLWKGKFVRPLINGERAALLLFLEQLHGLWIKATASSAQPDAFACGNGNVTIAPRKLPAPLAAPMDGTKHGMVAVHNGAQRRLGTPRLCSEHRSVPTVKHDHAHNPRSSSSNLGRQAATPLLRRSRQGQLSTMRNAILEQRTHFARKLKLIACRSC